MSFVFSFITIPYVATFIYNYLKEYFSKTDVCHLKLFDLKINLHNCCGCDYYGKEELAQHILDIHSIDHPAQSELSLDWLVVVPGLDHVRLNCCKTIFKFYWESHLKSIAQRLGYLMPKALQVAHDCSDLQKSDMILAVFMKAGTEVLSKWYIHHSDVGSRNANSMLECLERSNNPNVVFLWDAVYKYTLGYFMLKAGIRKNDINYFHIGKDLLGELFFVQNHPNYRKLFHYMDFERATMPKHLLEVSDKTIGVLVKDKGINDESLGEAYDFCVEDVNQKLKQNLGSAPAGHTWLIACRSYKFFQHFKKSLNQWLKFSRSLLKSISFCLSEVSKEGRQERREEERA